MSDKVTVSRSGLVAVLLYIGALQQTNAEDEKQIADLKIQLADAKANAGIDDPQLDAQIDAIAANAAAQPASTVVAPISPVSPAVVTDAAPTTAAAPATDAAPTA